MTPEDIIVENTPKIQANEKDDYLLAQIDEFRIKAQQLQNLLFTKETKAQELQEIVEAKKLEANELDLLLSERQRKADGLTEEVAKQIDDLIDKVSEKMEAISEVLSTQLQNEQKSNRLHVEELKGSFGVLNGQQTEEIKSMIGALNARQTEELNQALSELITQLEKVKTDLSSKVHTENVQCYRNLASLLKNIENKLDKTNEIKKEVLSIRKCITAVIMLCVMNMLGLVSLAIYELDIFQFLFK